MPTLSDERPKGNSKTAKQTTPSPAETLLYYGNDTDPHSKEEHAPVNLNDLYNASWGIVHMAGGILDLIDALTEPPTADGVIEPLLMARLACKHINDLAFSLTPVRTATGQELKWDKCINRGFHKGWVYSLEAEDAPDSAEEVAQ